MKKAIALLLVFAALFSFAACKNSDERGSEKYDKSYCVIISFCYTL